MTYERTAMNKLNKSIWLSDVYIKQGIAFSVDTQQLKKRKFAAVFNQEWLLYCT